MKRIWSPAGLLLLPPSSFAQASPFDTGARSLVNFALTIAILIVRTAPYRIAG
jgi:hypothetical protein